MALRVRMSMIARFLGYKWRYTSGFERPWLLWSNPWLIYSPARFCNARIMRAITSGKAELQATNRMP